MGCHQRTQFILSKNSISARTFSAQSLLPTGSGGNLAPFWDFLFAMSVFYHIAV